MIGQGSPSTRLRTDCFKLMKFLRYRFALIALTVFGLLSVSNCYLMAQGEGNSQSYRVRVTWGGGESISWQGQFSLTRGTVTKLLPLGLSFDAGGTSFVANQKAFVRSIKPANFSGFDLELNCDINDELHIDLFDADAPHNRFEQKVSVKQIVSNRFQTAIDGSGNRIEIARAPGDQIRVSFDRPHLVFGPGEYFSFRASSTSHGFPPASDVKLNVHVQRSHETREIWSSQWQFRVSPDGFFETDQDIQIPLPTEEGAYDIVMRLGTGARSSPFTWNQSQLERKLQVVVVDPNRAELGQAQLWQETSLIDPATDEWKQRFSDLTNLRFKEMVAGPLKNEKSSIVEYSGEKMTQLAPGGWQAIPISINELGKPHILEIEYLDEGPVSLGISFLQPDGTGQVPYFGADTGVHIPEQIGSIQQPKIRRHRMFVWPNHRAPYLLFANRHLQRSVTIGKIRVLSGPDELGAEQIANGQSRSAGRHYMAFYEKPLFAENFAVVKNVDPVTRQTVDDWNSFLEGARRWTQYLKASGYTGAMLVVSGDGSSLYPSEQIQPTPRFDNGIFASSGNDPIRKDIVELLLRVFQREGLQLVPVIHFNSALAELEQQRLAGDPTGIDLVDLKGNRRRLAYRDVAQPIALYNPLDSRVQSAMSKVTTELIHRYRGHESFGGLGLLYSQDAINLLPGQTWGLDQKTVQRFISHTPNMDAAGLDNERGLYKLLSGDQRAALMNWRSQQNGIWLSSVQQELNRQAPGKKVFILGTDLFQSQDAFSALAPSLRRSGNLAEAAWRIGLPTKTIKENKDILFLRPYEIGPEFSLNAQRASLRNNLSIQANEMFDSQAGGFLFSHRYWWAHFSQLEKSKPFGTNQASIMRMQPLVPGEFWNRQRLANAFLVTDCNYLIEGGVFASFGQEVDLGNWMESFAQMPTQPFEDIELGEDQVVPNGIVVRHVVADGKWYFYVVNTSPWPTSVKLELRATNAEIAALSNQEFDIDKSGTGETIAFNLAPFDIALGESLQIATISKVSSTYPDDIASALRTELEKLTSKKSMAEQAAPMNVLLNPGFEPVAEVNSGEAGQGISEFGWYYDPQLESQIQKLREAPHEGSAFLAMSSEGPNDITWIRSNIIPPPETGRLSVVVWLRTGNPDQQPPLRISVQGDVGRDVYYRYGTVGAQVDSDNPITNQWKPFAVHFDDIPTGGVGNLKVGFDLMGAGYVEIDHVQIFDRWLDDSDAAVMRQKLQLASFQLTNQRNYDSCRRMLEGYWPRFLDTYFQDPDEIARQVPTSSDEQTAKPRTSLLQKILPKF